VTEPTTPRRDVRGSHRAAGILTLIEALVLLGFTVFYLYEIVTGSSERLATAATSAVLILVFAVGFGVLTRGWWRGADWPRTPTVLLNALLLPVAWSLHDAGRTGLALAVAAVAVATIVAAVAAPSHRTFGGDPEASDSSEPGKPGGTAR
jgi:hypothetical protein